MRKLCKLPPWKPFQNPATRNRPQLRGKTRPGNGFSWHCSARGTRSHSPATRLPQERTSPSHRPPARDRRRTRASRSRSNNPMPLGLRPGNPARTRSKTRNRGYGSNLNAPRSTKRRAPPLQCSQENNGVSRNAVVCPGIPLGARDGRAGKSPGGALVHPCPRQYVIQPMLRRYGNSRASDLRCDRRPCHRTAVLATTMPATTVHPALRTSAARPGVAINHRNRVRIQSATRSTPHPSVLAVNSRTRRILAIHYAPALPADCLKHLSSNVKCCFPCGKRT